MAEQSSLTVASGVQVQRSVGPDSGLVRSMVAAAFRAEPIVLNRKTTSAQALFVIATSCLRQIALNERGVRAGSGEAVHQMRVGLRRLRAALSIFKPVLQPGEFDELKRELVWLTEQLAPARDYDVLIESKRKFEVVTKSVFAGVAELTSELSRRRQEAFLAASHAVADVRFERIIVSSAIRLMSRADEQGESADPVRELACRVLERRARRVLRGLARFARLDVRERHELRIRVKKLRHGIEFFAGVFPNSSRSRKHFSGALEALQETLGTLNDIDVQQRLTRDLVDESANGDRSSRRSAFAMGGLTGYQQAELRSLSARVPKLRARLAKAPRFWSRQS
jgi:CHAD domain-containing protein